MKKLAIATIAAATLLATATAEARCNGCNGGNYTQNYNYTGIQRGSGPYDSAIAQTGIAAGVGLLGKILDMNRPPQQIIINQAPTRDRDNYRYVPAATTGAIAPRCAMYQIGYDMERRPLFQERCR